MWCSWSHVNCIWFQVQAVAQGVSWCEEAGTLSGLQHGDLCFKLGKTASQKRYLGCHTLPCAACSFELTLQPSGSWPSPLWHCSKVRIAARFLCSWLRLFQKRWGWVSWGQRALRRRPRCLSLSFPPTPDLTARRGRREHLCSHASLPNNLAPSKRSQDLLKLKHATPCYVHQEQNQTAL